MLKIDKSLPIKIAIKNTINKKCITCKDNSFCKFKDLCLQVEEPKINVLESLVRCIFYKKI